MKPRKIDNVTVAHVASATKHTNIQILKKIRERCPDFALQRDVFGDTPAHYAAKYTESVDMLQFFIEADPTVLEMQGHDGNSPLHALVDRLDGDDLLLGLMECILSTQEGKNSLLIFNSQGNTPLSTACTKRNRRDVSGVISRLILANPDALKVSNLRGRLPIHELIENRAYPDEPMRHCLSTMVTFYEQFSRDGELNYFEPSSTLGRTLLHTVCDSPHGVRPEVIKQVLLAYPEAAAVSYDDIYPLDNILLKYQSFHAFEGEVTVDEVLFLILDAYPESAKVMRPSGWYPLHEAAHGCSLTAVQMVYEAYPEVIFSSVHRNGTPLHQASQNFNNGVVEFLLAKYPDAVRIPNESFGQLPLHFAIDQFRSLEAVRGLFDFYPVAVIIPYTNGPSVLHYLFQRAYEIQRLRNPTSLWGDIVRFALRHCPAAATSSDSYGRTVYHWAVINKDSTHPYFLRLLLRAAPELDPDELRRLNSEDRRGALYLLLLAIFPIGEGKTIWQRLKEHGDRQLFKEVILFL
jgi:ankyrin repeat protein